MTLFLDAISSRGSSGSVEQQEAQGQTSFVNSETLPTDMDKEDKTALESCGVKFLDKVEGDEMFQYVELPQGWKKQPTDHSMWSYLWTNKAASEPPFSTRRRSMIVVQGFL